MNPNTWQPQDWMFAIFAFAITYGVAFARGYYTGRKQEREEKRVSRLKELTGRK